MLLGSTCQREFEKQAGRLRVARVACLNCIDGYRFRDRHSEKLLFHLGWVRRVEAERAVRAKRMPRSGKRETRACDPVVKLTKRSEVIQWKDYDVRLQKTLGRAQCQRERCGSARDWLQFFAKLFGPDARRDWPDTGRPGDCQMGRLVSCESRIIPFVDVADSVAGGSLQLGKDENPVELHSSSEAERDPWSRAV